MTPNVCCPECGFEITKALAQARAEGRASMREEAARAADYYAKNSATAKSIAAAIRALKDGEPKP